MQGSAWQTVHNLSRIAASLTVVQTVGVVSRSIAIVTNADDITFLDKKASAPALHDSMVTSFLVYWFVFLQILTNDATELP